MFLTQWEWRLSQIGVTGATEEGGNVTTRSASKPLARDSDPLAELVRDAGCAINPGSKPSVFVGAGMLHWI